MLAASPGGCVGVDPNKVELCLRDGRQNPWRPGFAARAVGTSASSSFSANADLSDLRTPGAGEAPAKIEFTGVALLPNMVHHAEAYSSSVSLKWISATTVPASSVTTNRRPFGP